MFRPRFFISPIFLSLILTCANATAQSQRSTQLLVVTTSSWDAVQGKLQRYERANPRGRWQLVGQPISVVVGKSGLGWGLGLRSARAASGPIKKEGDGRAP